MEVDFRAVGNDLVFVSFPAKKSLHIQHQIKELTDSLMRFPFNGMKHIIATANNMCIYYEAATVAVSALNGHTALEKVINYISKLLHTLQENVTQSVQPITVALQFDYAEIEALAQAFKYDVAHFIDMFEALVFTVECVSNEGKSVVLYSKQHPDLLILVEQGVITVLQSTKKVFEKASKALCCQILNEIPQLFAGAQVKVVYAKTRV